MSTRVLIIDGDISLATVLRDYLVSRGYQAAMETSAREALSRLNSEHWEIVLMELQGIGMNGYELLKGIRHRLPKLPIFILSSRSDREDQMRAFELGADDYILKPFSMDLLICRIEAVLRDYILKPFSMDLLICRIEAVLRRIRAYEENRQKVFQLGTHIFDSVHQSLDGAHLSSRESDLLLMLCRNEREVVDKHKILSALWKEDNAFTARSLGVYINHLRGHLRPIGYEIIAVRYKGYKLVTDVTV